MARYTQAEADKVLAAYAANPANRRLTPAISKPQKPVFEIAFGAAIAAVVVFLISWLCS